MRHYVSLFACAALLAPVSRPAFAQVAAPTQPVTLHFRSDASNVLQALARKARANIIVPEDIKKVITVDLRDVPIEQAVSLIAGEAGVAYRRVGDIFIVADPKIMPQVLEQSGISEAYSVNNIDPTNATDKVRAAVPFLTVRPAGKVLTLIGAPSDIEQAKAILKQLDVAPTITPSTYVSIQLQNVKSSDVANVLKDFPSVVTRPVGDFTLSLSGPDADIKKVSDIVKALDSGQTSNAKYTVYHVKYSSARNLALTLRQAIQNITVVSGPDPFYIQKTQTDLSSGASTLNGVSGSSGSDTSGGFGSTGSGSTGSVGSSGGFGSTSGIGGSTGGIGSSIGGGQGQSNSRPTTGEGTRTLIIGGVEENVTKALDLLSKIDIPTPQVALDVKVVSTSPSVTQNLGVEWSQSISTTGFESNGFATGTNGVTFPIAPGSNSSSSGSSTQQGTVLGNLGFGAIGRLPISFTATLNAFFQRQDVKVLAKPTITALDNEDGVIFVGETRRVSVANVQQGLGSSVVVNSIVEIPVGIILQMRPRVGDGDMITLRVHPSYTSASAVNTSTGLFDTLVRDAETTIRVKSGETIVIGGLLQDEDTKTFTKVPFLGDIPIIGNLFRNHSHDHLRREVLVFVTPHLIKD